jgi:diaminopimelate decarboxylase
VLSLTGLHAHIGSQIFELEPYTLAIRALGELAGDWCRIVNVGGGLGIAYTVADEPPSIESYVDVKVRGVGEVFGEDVRILVEPGRSLVGNAGLTAYRVGTVKEIPGVRTYVAVDGGMSDNLRPMLYDARYDAAIASRPDAMGTQLATIAGMHCESGDILIKEVALADPQIGDVLVTPATGAYGYAMANNYNGVPRPPVIFCRDGEARVVVRRETYEDLAARDA